MTEEKRLSPAFERFILALAREFAEDDVARMFGEERKTGAKSDICCAPRPKRKATRPARRRPK